MPRVCRASLRLNYRLQARPVRQPLLDFAGDDDLVAAYCGYDNIDDFNRFRFIPMLVSQIAVEFAMKLRPEHMIPVIHILQTGTEHHQSFKSWGVSNGGFSRGIFLQYGAPSRDYADMLVWDTFCLSQPSYLKSHIAYGCPDLPLRSHDTVRRLPNVNRDVRQFKAPDLIRLSQEIEGSVRVAMLGENIKIVMKPGKWEREVKHLVERKGAFVPSYW